MAPIDHCHPTAFCLLFLLFFFVFYQMFNQYIFSASPCPPTLFPRLQLRICLVVTLSLFFLQLLLLLVAHF
ncbi:unnamed protein product [Caenorhabditis angaria]|uniref:Uncharacterized protein n=1 Tax=Caenorhabditis angaria TaxID=860376 RepID=A0A9P1ITX4_9PELO|nr:unnamed protein product [Caenorhabditis angaria]